MTHPLGNGVKLPALSFSKVGGGTLSLPDDFAGSYGVLQVYRGAFCPYCNEMLAGYQAALSDLTDAGIKMAAISVEDEAKATELAAKHQLEFPVGYGADPDQMAEATGAFTREVPIRPKFLEATGFILNPLGQIVAATYSTGPVGRIVPSDVLRVVAFAKARAAEAKK